MLEHGISCSYAYIEKSKQKSSCQKLWVNLKYYGTNSCLSTDLSKTWPPKGGTSFPVHIMRKLKKIFLSKTTARFETENGSNGLLVTLYQVCSNNSYLGKKICSKVLGLFFLFVYWSFLKILSKASGTI